MKTAVEWLIEKLITENEVILKGENYKLFEQAKEMEKERLLYSIRMGLASLGEWTPESEESILREYETFKSE